MLGLHITGHPPAAAEIMPFRETPGNSEFPIPPGESVRTGGTFRVKGRGVKLDGDGFRYEMVYFTLLKGHLIRWVGKRVDGHPAERT